MCSLKLSIHSKSLATSVHVIATSPLFERLPARSRFARSLGATSTALCAMEQTATGGSSPPRRQRVSPTNETEETEACVVCLDEVCALDSTTLSCGHRAFHEPCITRWLRSRPCCPLCGAAQSTGAPDVVWALHERRLHTMTTRARRASFATSRRRRARHCRRSALLRLVYCGQRAAAGPSA